MRVKCVRRFRDMSAGTFREVGATFDVDEKRLHEINSAGYGQLVQKVDESPSESVSEPQKATSRKAPAKRRTRTTKKTAEAAE